MSFIDSVETSSCGDDGGEEVKEKAVNPLIIQGIDTGENDPEECSFKDVFDPPFIFCVNGAPKKGKTNMIVHLIKNLFNNFFHRIIVWSDSAKKDKVWEFADVLKHDLREVWDEDEEADVDRIMQSQNTIIKKLGKPSAPHVLFVIDDMASNKRLMQHKFFNQLGFNHRHFKISVVFLTQVWRRINSDIRKTCSNTAIFETGNNEEFKTIADELSQPSILTRDQFRQLNRESTKKQYGFLHINRRAKSSLEMFSFGFHQAITLKPPERNPAFVRRRERFEGKSKRKREGVHETRKRHRTVKLEEDVEEEYS